MMYSIIQVLPVVPHGSRNDIVGQALTKSPIWPHVRIHRLQINMRVQQAAHTNEAATLQEFANYLLSVGSGREAVFVGTEDRIRLPDNMVLPSDNLLSLIDYTFGDLATTPLTNAFLMGHAILTPKNKHVAAINDHVIDRLLGEVHEFASADSMEDPEDQTRYQPEFLNSLQPSSLPPHLLRLKIGCPVMLLRNLDATKGLCNGTRLIVRSFRRYVIEAEVASGSHIGDIALIPRIRLNATEDQCPILFTRTQFPIRLAFSMTINKSQGQTFDKVGLYLPDPPFAHGQLYVAMSRIRTPSSIRILINRESSQIPDQSGYYTRNVVYTEVLT